MRLAKVLKEAEDSTWATEYIKAWQQYADPNFLQKVNRFGELRHITHWLHRVVTTLSQVGHLNQFFKDFFEDVLVKLDHLLRGNETEMRAVMNILRHDLQPGSAFLNKHLEKFNAVLQYAQIKRDIEKFIQQFNIITYQKVISSTFSEHTASFEIEHWEPTDEIVWPSKWLMISGTQRKIFDKNYGAYYYLDASLDHEYFKLYIIHTSASTVKTIASDIENEIIKPHAGYREP